MDIETAVSALGALGQEDRLAAFRLLMAEGGTGLPSGEIAQKLDVPPTRMSFHLMTLERAGLIERRREGRMIRYSVCHKAMRSLLGFLVNDCCRNNPAVCSFDVAPFDFEHSLNRT